MENNQLFITATRKGFRYPSPRGLLTTEDLWQLPLTSKQGFDLDTTAKSINASLKAISEESFVSTKPNARVKEFELALEVVKFIIATKIEEAQVAAEREAKAEKKRKLTELLAKKQDQSLEQLSEEDLKKQIEELSS